MIAEDRDDASQPLEVRTFPRLLKYGGASADWDVQPTARFLQVRGMWPYWMDVSSQEPVPNDINSMDSLYLLTGTQQTQRACQGTLPVQPQPLYT